RRGRSRWPRPRRGRRGGGGPGAARPETEPGRRGGRRGGARDPAGGPGARRPAPGRAHLEPPHRRLRRGRPGAGPTGADSGRPPASVPARPQRRAPPPARPASSPAAPLGPARSPPTALAMAIMRARPRPASAFAPLALPYTSPRTPVTEGTAGAAAATAWRRHRLLELRYGEALDPPVVWR